MAIKKKPVLRKPIAGKGAAPRPKALPESEPQADEAPVAPLPPEPNDELALQEMPEVNYPGEAFKRPRKKAPVQNTGTSLDIHDTSKMLVVAWCVMGAVIAISVYLLLVHSSNSDEETRKANAAEAPKPAAPKAPPKEDPKDARLKANPANRTAAEAYFKFGKWAYSEAADWDGAKLSERFNSDVPLGNVDDPDIRELCRMQLENFALVKDHPLRPFESVAGGSIDVQQGTQPANVQKYKLNDNKMSALTLALRTRYGLK